MRSQLRFVMHPDDESEFATLMLADEHVHLIDGPRWKSASPRQFRSLDQVTGRYCIIWSMQDCPTLSARYIPACDDWYCNSEEFTIQFLRSDTVGAVITEGRIAVSTPATESEGTQSLERRFKQLARFIKKHSTNSIVQWCNPDLPFLPAVPGRSANPSKPDPQVWIGRHAVNWLQEDKERRVKQFAQSSVEARLIDSFVLPA
ncbi:hypothetical protein [Massilia aquatica]|uniref:Uncharacterized protein n=1 Tax=Massilia aquatica TaxID=2609000 RepID=A0ABX0MAJ6_9BURK|nr:hypothetical protein [Massilia aquatica]NHZ41542.1 hypothetical protein [Massilia aquatica]